MYSKEIGNQKSADQFFQQVIAAKDNALADLQKKIIEYGIALKLSVRTFKFRGA